MTVYRHLDANTPAVPRRGALSFSRSERWQLVGLYGFVAWLHVLGWGLFIYYSAHFPALAGLGMVAYLFGVRHAFDADHIAAVDDTVRYLLQQGKKPLSVGFFFSLGHSTVVFGLAIAIILASGTVARYLPALRSMGTIVGAGVSGLFLLLIAGLNVVVLLDLLKVWRANVRSRSRTHSHTHVDELLRRRGLMNRLLGGRLQKVLRHSWQTYPLGLLFGLGFDTASEIGLLAMVAGAAAGNLPAGALLSLPLLFAAGMTVMDTTDGVLMTKAYDWALVNPLRRVFYNITTTGLSIAVALLIGTIELLQVLRTVLNLDGPFFDFVGALDLGIVGYLVVGLFLMIFGTSVALWHFGQLGEGEASDRRPHAHEHEHADGVRHSHKHLH
jgi:high-affinity nickel-transport protein